MDNISGFPDELLVRILSFVPTKVAVSTSIFSSRWKFLWMWLPKLDYTDRKDSLLVLRDFINKNLPLHRAPVIKSLHLGLCELRYPHIKAQDIKLWVEIAVSRHVRELKIYYYKKKDKIILPSSLFTCKSLVTLKLINLTLMDVSTMVCLPSLKTLQLKRLTYADDKSFQALLSIYHVLEDLRVEDWNESPCLFKSMPKLREAHVDVSSFAIKSVIGSVTSVKHLTVCSEDVYGDGIVFDQLEHLELCMCQDDSLNLLAQFLKSSPSLRVLEMYSLESHGNLSADEMVSWNQPSCVPECLLSSLQSFSLSPFIGRPQDRDIAVYILKNARYLRTATIWANIARHDVPSIEMIKELTLSSRASSTCELVIIE